MINKIGVCEWSFPQVGPASLSLAAAAGYEGIQLGDLGGIASGFPLNDRCVQDAYLEASERLGVCLQAIHPNFLQRQALMVSEEGTAKWDDSMLSLKKGIEACSALGIGEFMLSAYFASWIQNDYEIKRYLKHLNAACDYAQDAGVQVSFEGTMVPENYLRLIEGTKGRLKICYDVRNSLTLGISDARTDIREIGIGNISHFHYKDCLDDLESWCLNGEGAADIAGITEIIKATGYTGWFVSETDYMLLAPRFNYDLLEAARQDCRNMKGFLYWQD